jgi:NTP pyrophosphatase (non-canonical NTP hydrolase)
MDAQSRVATFVEANDLEAPAAYRLLDAVSELGEVAKAVCTSTGYGADAGDVAVPADELGDALFALLALCESLDVDAEAAWRRRSRSTRTGWRRPGRPPAGSRRRPAGRTSSARGEQAVRTLPAGAAPHTRGAPTGDGSGHGGSGRPLG